MSIHNFATGLIRLKSKPRSCRPPVFMVIAAELGGCPRVWGGLLANTIIDRNN